MKVFSLKEMLAYPYEERDKNVFFKSPEFKTRIIALAPGEKLPDCEMKSHVIFYIISGHAEYTINGESGELTEGEYLISEPGDYSISTRTGVKILGIQIHKK